jgi:hypothetical protein
VLSSALKAHEGHFKIPIQLYKKTRYLLFLTKKILIWQMIK